VFDTGPRQDHRATRARHRGMGCGTSSIRSSDPPALISRVVVAAIRRMRPLPARFPNAATSRKPGLYVRRSIAYTVTVNVPPQLG
jgi:hypothetical protein